MRDGLRFIWIVVMAVLCCGMALGARGAEVDVTGASGTDGINGEAGDPGENGATGGDGESVIAAANGAGEIVNNASATGGARWRQAVQEVPAVMAATAATSSPTPMRTVVPAATAGGAPPPPQSVTSIRCNAICSPLSPHKTQSYGCPPTRC